MYIVCNIANNWGSGYDDSFGYLVLYGQSRRNVISCRYLYGQSEVHDTMKDVSSGSEQ